MAFVTRLVGILRGHHIPVWFSASDIVGAQQWHDEIGAALKRCDWFIVVLSRNSVESRWVKDEYLYALRHRDQYGKRILPILLERCDTERLSWTLDDVQMLRFDKGVDAGYYELFRVWGIGYRQPAINPVSSQNNQDPVI